MCDRMASPKSRIHPEKVVSFKLFELEQKGKLKSAYPFLSADQINRKIKDLWKCMGNEQKQNYTRLIMKSTPVKKRASEKSENKMYNDRKRKLNSSVAKAKKRKVGLTICDTPETVNTKKLNDFRKEHAESYENDFKSSPACYGRRNRLTPDVSVTDRKRRCSKDGNTSKTGILKLRDSGRKSTDMGRVSFNSPAEIRQTSQETDDSVYDGRFTDDDDDTGVLIRRDDVIDISLDQVSTQGVTSTGFIGRDSQPDDDDDMSALLMRRDDDYDDIDRHEMVIDDGYSGPATFIRLDGAQGKDSTCITNTNIDDDRNLDKKVAGPKDNEINKKEDKTKMETEAHDHDTDESQLFKSPFPSASKKRNEKLKKKKAMKGDNCGDTVRTPATVHSNLTCNQVTPMLTGSQDDRGSYTTPLMDENLQQLAFEEASKAPQKRRQTFDSNPNDKEKLKALHSGRRVTRSLMITSDHKSKISPEIFKLAVDAKCTMLEDLNVEVHHMDPGGDARRATPGNDEDTVDLPSNILEPNSHATPDQYKPEATESTLVLKRKIETNKRQNCRKSRKENYLMSMVIPHYNSPDVEELPDLLDICSNYSSQSSDSSYRSPKRSQHTNPALEAALRKLRCTAAGSPTLSVGAHSDVSSPGLLSPALSGVSELSSTSSGCMEQDKPLDSPAGAAGDDHCEKPAAGCIQPANRDRNLCQLFKDVTPLDKKTKGKYKTQRLVSSGGGKENKNFKQLFEDSDFLFC